MNNVKTRSGWALAAVILTGFLFVTSLVGIFAPLMSGDFSRFVTSMFLTIFVGTSFTFSLIGYINKNSSFLLVSSIFNAIYSVLGFIGLVFIFLASVVVKDFTYINEYSYLAVIVFLFFFSILGLIYLIFLTLSSFIGYFNQKKLNQINLNNLEKNKSSIKNEK